MRRLPNRYGTVTKLKGNRRRPWIVKAWVGTKDTGAPKYDIVGYTETYEAGLSLLAEYRNDPWDVDAAKITVGELYDLWYKIKFPKLGEKNRASLRSAYKKHCSRYKDHVYKTLRSYQMQECIDNCGKGHGTQTHIKNMWNHLDDLALELGVIKQGYSQLLTTDSAPETSRTRLSDAEVDALWANQGIPGIDAALILTYSGWRISELLEMPPEAVDLELGTMTGGKKTEAGKDRIVPIHSRIRPIVEHHLAEGGPTLICYENKAITPHQYREYFWKPVIVGQLGIQKTPHECRHTFRSRLDSAGANKRCMDLMMGHKSADTGDRIYTHKTIEELKAAIELITN